MNYKDLVAKFRYQHRETFPKQCYDQCFKFEKGIPHMQQTSKLITSGELQYRFMKRCNSESFEYGGKTTTVDITPLTSFYSDRDYTRILMTTIDDSSMNLWLKPQPKQVIYKILKFYTGKRIISSCWEEYELLANNMGWLSHEEHIKQHGYDERNPYTGKSKYIHTLPDSCQVLDIDFN